MRGMLGAMLLLLAGWGGGALAQDAPKLPSASTSDGLFEVEAVDEVTIQFLTPTTGEAMAIFEFSKPITSLQLNRNGGVVYIGYGDGSVEARETLGLGLRWQNVFFDKPVRLLARADGEVMAVDDDGSAVIVDARNGEKAPDSPDDALSLSEPISAMFNSVSVTIYNRFGEQRYNRQTGIAQTKFYPTRQVTRRIMTSPGGNGVPPTYTTVTETVVVGPVGLPPVIAGVTTDAMLINAPGATSSPRLFPWPPPRPSDSYTVPAHDLRAAGLGRFRDVEQRVVRVLLHAGALAPAYYVLATGEDVHGFALVTRVEEILEDGTPVKFVEEDDDEGGFSLSSLLGLFTSAPKGYYRVIAFVVTDDTSVGEKREVTRAEAEGWLTGNVSTLPAAVAARPIEDHFLSILVYQFEKPNKQQAAYLTHQPKAPVLRHLENSRLTDAVPRATVQP